MDQASITAEAIVTRELQWFSKHEDSDTVSIKVRTRVVVADKTVADVTGTEYGSDARLLAAAEGPWDEDVLCGVYGLQRSEGVRAARAAQAASEESSTPRSVR